MSQTTFGSSTEHVTVERLSAYLDQELLEDEALQLKAHLEACDICHQRLSGLREVTTSLRQLEKMALPEGFERMVARRIALTEKPARAFDRLETLLSGFGRQSPFFSLFAVVIALAVILFLFSQAVHQRRQQTTPILFEPPTEDVGHTVDGEVVLQLRVAGRLMHRAEDGWLQDGTAGRSVDRVLIRGSESAQSLFAKHPELKPLRDLPGSVVFELDGSILELR